MVHLLIVSTIFFTTLFVLSSLASSYLVRFFQEPKGYEASVVALFQRASGRSTIVDMNWKQYATALLLFHAILLILLVTLLFFSYCLIPGQIALTLSEAFSIAISFMTNTDWQSYVPEEKLTDWLQMIALLPQMFLSPAIGLTVAISLIRGIVLVNSSGHIGNFYTDLFRVVFFLMLPLGMIFGVILSFFAVSAENGLLAIYGAIQNLGTNGGGFFNANIAHPLQNPSPWTHVIMLFSMFFLPTTLLLSFGLFSQNRLFSRRIYCMCTLFFIGALILCTMADRSGSLGLVQSPYLYANLEGKELRFGAFWSIFQILGATATSTGSTSALLSGCMPVALIFPMLFMEVGEVIFGGVGTGFIVLFIFSLIAIFTSGLMVGRTPEIFHKKITTNDMYWALTYFLLPIILITISLSILLTHKPFLMALVSTPLRSITELVYALSSVVYGNGSAITTINGSWDSWNILLDVLMLFGRLLPMVAVVGLASAFIQKIKVPDSSGSLHVESMPSIIWIGLVIFVIGALSYIPAIVLGPVFEQLVSS